jgi:hypothetical protein
LKQALARERAQGYAERAWEAEDAAEGAEDVGYAADGRVSAGMWGGRTAGRAEDGVGDGCGWAMRRTGAVEDLASWELVGAVRAGRRA